MKQYFKSVESVENLLFLLAHHPEANVRQISCVYLRKIVANLWCNVPEEKHAQYKALLLDRFVQEPVTIVKKNIAEVIGKLGMLLIPNKEW